MKAPKAFKYSHRGAEAEGHIVAMYRGGMSAIGIGYEFFTTNNTVLSILRRHGVEIRPCRSKEGRAWKTAHPRVRR